MLIQKHAHATLYPLSLSYIYVYIYSCIRACLTWVRISVIHAKEQRDIYIRQDSIPPPRYYLRRITYLIIVHSILVQCSLHDISSHEQTISSVLCIVNKRYVSTYELCILWWIGADRRGWGSLLPSKCLLTATRLWLEELIER